MQIANLVTGFSPLWALISLKLDHLGELASLVVSSIIQFTVELATNL